MSITDELREWVTDHYSGWKSKQAEGIAIADRIDVEHERRMEERADRYSESRAKMNNCYIELPKDADGEYISVGDVMELTRLSNKPSFEVRAMRYDEGGWEVFDRLGDRYEPFALRHYHAPTVEDVLTEFGIDWEHESDCEDRAALLKEYAAKLRLAEEDA